jgi:hypothetical protein
VNGERSVSEPSYILSAVGGFFLGVLGIAILVLFPDQQWGMAVVPIVGLAAAILGTYVAAEPYVELRESYDRLISEAAAQVSVTQAPSDQRNVEILEERAHKAEAAHQVAELARKRAEETALRETKALSESEERLARIETVINQEGAKLLDAAAELGADGEKVAAVAEVLRQECIKLRNPNAVKRSEM